MAKTTKMVEVSPDDLHPYARNAKIHGEEQLEKLKASIQEFGFISPCLIDKDNNIIAGHGRVLAAQALGLKTVPCVYIEGLTEAQRRAYILADNRLSELGEWDMELVNAELEALDLLDFDFTLTGFNSAGGTTPQEQIQETARATLADRFLVSPFSVLDRRTGWWSTRKAAWRSLGIRSEIGRGNDDDSTQDGLVFANSAQPPVVYKQKNKYEEQLGRKVTWAEFYEAYPNAAAYNGTSIFDPVICEIAYRWFSAPGAKILDPFAGGSVRGIVAALLEREYTGVDLSARQILANRENWDEISHDLISRDGTAVAPNWIIGDSLHIKDLAPGEYDLIFTCPPYADLEVYSDNPADLSTMDYSDFLKVYREIIKNAVSMLKQNAFAVVVVSDIRDREGNLRNFVSDTIDAFQDAGMKYYNEGIYINSVGSAATRAARQFEASRKPVKVHQNVLVFFADGELRTIGLDDPDETSQDIKKTIQDRGGRFVQAHDKMLTFVKGDGRKATSGLGDVDLGVADEYFEVNIDE